MQEFILNVKSFFLFRVLGKVVPSAFAYASAHNFAVSNLHIHSIGFVILTFFGAEYGKDLSQPTFQSRINVVSTFWINIRITLIRRWIFNVAQR